MERSRAQVLLWLVNMHTPVASLNAYPCPNPWNSGPNQWARSGVGLKPSAAARPDVLRWKKRPAHTSAYIAPIIPLPGDSANLGAINIAVIRGGEEIHVRAGGGVCMKSKKKTRERDPRCRGQGLKSRHGVTDLIFKPLNPFSWPTYSPGPGAGGTVQVAARGARGGKRRLFFFGSWLGRVLLGFFSFSGSA